MQLIINDMVIDMNDSQVCTMAQVREFLQGTARAQFRPLGDDLARYRHMAAVVRRFSYARRPRPERGLLLRYLRLTTAYSRAQLTRLVGRVLEGQTLAKWYVAPAHAFARRFGPQDVALLAEVERQFDTLSGPATVHLLRCAFAVYGDVRFERLGAIYAVGLEHSTAHPNPIKKSKIPKTPTPDMLAFPQPDQPLNIHSATPAQAHT